nr:novel immune-type receptor 2a, allele 3 [Danio rerio]
MSDGLRGHKPVMENCSSETTDIKNYLKIVQAGDTVNFTCSLFNEIRNSVVWIKQSVGKKPLPVVSSFQNVDHKFDNDFDKQKRFFVTKDDVSFNLSITNTEVSDSATYYCITYAYHFTFGNSTDLIVKAGELNIKSDHQRSASEDQQCSVISQSCAEEHKVYWFRQRSGESPPGVIYTQDSRSAQCEKSSDLNSTAHKCIYSLPKTDEDPAIYYCAVAACGQILFGDGKKAGLKDECFQTHWITALLIITASSMIVNIILSVQLHKYRQKDRFYNTQSHQLSVDHADGLNYAALSFQQNPSTSRKSSERNLQDTAMYAHTRRQQM